MKIPKTLKIGTQTYSVGEMGIDAPNGRYGQSSTLHKYIHLNKSNDKERTEHTFLHELIHMILDEAEYMDESSNEKMVSALASGLYQVLTDNNFFK